MRQNYIYFADIFIYLSVSQWRKDDTLEAKNISLANYVNAFWASHLTAEGKTKDLSANKSMKKLKIITGYVNI